MTYEQNNYLFTIGLLHNSTSPHPSSTFSLDFFHPALIYNSQTMTCICHTDIIPGVDVGVAVYYRYTAEVRENVTNKQYVLKFAKAHQKYFPQNLSILLPSKIFCSDSVKDDFLLSNIFSSISNFYLYTLKTLPRMAQKYILSLNHIIWDPAYQLKNISMKSLRL